MEPPTIYYVQGELGTYDRLDGKPVMLSAGVAWNNPGDGFRCQVPDASSLFVDSGGFQAATKWDSYPYTPTMLHEWADSIGAEYVAGIDVACERREKLLENEQINVKADPGTVKHRMHESLKYQRRQRREHERHEYDHTFVPVIQGYEKNDFLLFVDWMEQHDLIRPYMGIGTICKRARPDEIYEVVLALNNRLPDVEWHLFGATRTIYKQQRFWGMFRSSDTAAWRFIPSEISDLFEYDILGANKKERDMCLAFHYLKDQRLRDRIQRFTPVQDY